MAGGGTKIINVIGNIYNNILKGLQMGKKLIALQGSARCFAPGTLVRMYNGRLKKVEDIRVGDKVMNMTGDGYNTVTEVHSGIDMMYRIVQPRGEDYIVNSRHILSLKQTEAFITHGFARVRKKIPYDKNAILDIPICNYLAQSNNFKRRFAGFKNTYIQLPKQELKIDPYYLGMWIGDGSSKAWYEISNIDKEVLDWFYQFAESLGTKAEVRDRVTHKMVVCSGRKKIPDASPAIINMFAAFKEYNLINNKHVPDVYVYGDYEDRLKFLAGLIDADGTNTGRNTISISQKNRYILESVLEICRISGFYTNGIREKISTMKRKDGSVYKCKTYFIEINHSDFNDLNKYIRVKRKRIENKNCERNYFTTGISVEEVGLGEYFGFSLDNEPHFLLADGTVVHNSGKTRNTIIFLIQCALETKVHISIVRASLPVLKRSVFRDDFKEVMLQMGIWNQSRMNKTEMTYTFDNGSIIEFFATDGPEGAQKARGPGRDILFCNEANELDEENFKQLRMRTRNFVIIDFNPSFTDEHWVYRLLSDDRTYHFISTFKDNVFLTDNIREEIESYKYTNPALWEIYGLGKFAIVEGLVYPKETWDIVDITDLPVGIPVEKRIGIDIGFSGKGDPTAAVLCYFANINGVKHMWVQELVYEKGINEKQLAYRLKAYNSIKKYIDSANPLYIQNLEDSGLQLVYPVVKYANSVIDGINKVQGYKLHIIKGSTSIIKELKNYCWMKDRHDAYTNQPIDKFNHSMDAMRYATMSDRSGRGLKHRYTKAELNL